MVGCVVPVSEAGLRSAALGAGWAARLGNGCGRGLRAVICGRLRRPLRLSGFHNHGMERAVDVLRLLRGRV